jgi:hypothetical protein
MVIAALASHVPMPWGYVDTDVFAAWGQWAGGIGSIAAVGVALGVLVRDRRLIEAQRATAEAERQRERVEARVMRARTVVAGRADVMYRPYPSERTNQGVPTVGIEISNHGLTPVMGVILEEIGSNRAGETFRYWSLATPFGRDLIRAGDVVADVLGPGESAQLPNLDVEVEQAAQRQGVLDVVITFTFMDAEGYRWRRVGRTTPVLIAEDNL